MVHHRIEPPDILLAVLLVLVALAWWHTTELREAIERLDFDARVSLARDRAHERRLARMAGCLGDQRRRLDALISSPR